VRSVFALLVVTMPSIGIQFARKSVFTLVVAWLVLANKRQIIESEDYN
jgi:hypothetical protein